MDSKSSPSSEEHNDRARDDSHMVVADQLARLSTDSSVPVLSTSTSGEVVETEQDDAMQMDGGSTTTQDYGAWDPAATRHALLQPPSPRTRRRLAVQSTDDTPGRVIVLDRRQGKGKRESASGSLSANDLDQFSSGTDYASDGGSSAFNKAKKKKKPSSLAAARFGRRGVIYRVSNACATCKRSKTRCDNGRPCGRCVRLKREHSCVDSVHRKRGRKKTELMKMARVVESNTVMPAHSLRDGSVDFSHATTVATPHGSVRATMPQVPLGSRHTLTQSNAAGPLNMTNLFGSLPTPNLGMVGALGGTGVAAVPRMPGVVSGVGLGMPMAAAGSSTNISGVMSDPSLVGISLPQDTAGGPSSPPQVIQQVAARQQFHAAQAALLQQQHQLLLLQQQQQQLQQLQQQLQVQQQLQQQMQQMQQMQTPTPGSLHQPQTRMQ